MPRTITTPGARNTWLAYALVLAVAATARGADTPAARAQAVVEAVRTRDEARLRALAADDAPDPWVVADELCRLGATDAASQYAAAAAGRPDTAALAACVAGRIKAPPADAVRTALAQAEADPVAATEALLAACAGAAPFDQARLRRALARAFGRAMRIEEACASGVLAADEAERIGWLSFAATALDKAAGGAYLLADFERVRRLWERRLVIEKRRRRPDQAGACSSSLGELAAETGDLARAVTLCQESVDAYVSTGDAGRIGALRSLANLAIVRQRRGEYGDALAACDRAKALVRDGENAQRARFLLITGDVHLDLGDVARAIESHRAALAAALSTKDAVLTAVCRGSIATDLAWRGELDAAIESYEEALKSFELAGSEPHVVRTLNNLCSTESRRNNWTAALRHGERARALAVKLKDDVTAAHVMQNLARACRGAGDLASANSWTTQSLAIAERLDSSRLLADGWRGAAEDALLAHDPARAVDAGRRAIVQVLRMTSGLAEGQGALARERYGKVFRTAVAAAIASGDAATLFEFAESSRAIDFLASLEQGDAVRGVAVPRALREAEESARIAESTAAKRHGSALAAGDLATIKARRAELDSAGARHEEAMERIRRGARGAAALFPTSVTEAEARAALAADDALVIYALADEKAAALVLTSKATRLVPLGATKDVAATCAAWDPSADAPKTDAAIAAMKRALVDPLALASTTRRVLVSPDGDVFHAPLAALFAGREVVHAPSASSYVLLAADKALRGTKVLAVGAPDYAGTKLAALPESGVEAKAVGDVVLVGAAATEAGVRDAVAKEKRWRSIHFAVHGLVDEKRPMRSGLVLTAAEPDDGVLTAMEVVTAATPADLVVLSACDSGGGRVFTGEGLVGMPRAFLFAGSPRVIASSWKVDDAAARALMTRFYELWRGKGLRASAALAGAQDAVRAEERWRHPRYWAAWTLWGVGD